MKISTLFIIVLAIILLISGIYCVVVTNISISLNNELTVLKHDRNLIMQDLNAIKNEYESKQRLIEVQNILLDKVKNAKTFKEYIAVWKELNQ